MTPLLLEARGVVVGYRGVRVIEGVSLGVSAGELLGLVGPNGAGKSTLLRAVAGLIEPEEGEVRLRGAELRAVRRRDRARAIGFVPQDTRVDFPLSVEQIVLLGRHPHGGGMFADGARDYVRAAEALDRVGMLHFRDRAYATLSGGERQLVMLARALCGEPEVLLLDEPVSALDVRHQLLALEIVRDFVAEGGACIVVLHDLNLAARYCDRIVVLDRGRVTMDGEPSRVLQPGPLRDAYRVAVAVRHDEVLNRPGIVAVRRQCEAPVVVAGSGPEMTAALAELFRRGYVQVTAIVVPGGHDEALARALGFDVRHTLGPEPGPILVAGEPPLSGVLPDAPAIVQVADDLDRALAQAGHEPGVRGSPVRSEPSAGPAPGTARDEHLEISIGGTR